VLQSVSAPISRNSIYKPVGYTVSFERSNIECDMTSSERGPQTVELEFLISYIRSLGFVVDREISSLERDGQSKANF
jgi:hypothetical protein